MRPTTLLLAAGLAAVMLTACAGAPPEQLMRAPHRFTRCPDSPNCVSSQAPKASARYVAPLAYAGDPAPARAALRALLEARSNVALGHVGPNYIHAVFTTPLGFVDDVTFAPRADAARIDVKSASRAGYYDFGKNRRRVAALRRAFDQRLGRSSNGG